MTASNPIKQKIKSLQAQGIKRVKFAICDIDGVLRGKYISLDKFASLMQDTGGFCDCVFGWDVCDNLYDNTDFTGWHTAYPDAHYQIDLTSERMLADENVPFFLADFVDKNKTNGHPICPRSVFKQVLKQLEDLGFKAKLAFEYEFFLFDETPQSIRDKNYQTLKPLTPGMFGYSTIRNSTESELFNEFMDHCLEMGIPIEGLHCETGPGVWEAAIAVDDALNAADKAVLFKTFSKSFFQKRGIMATFMAKWSMDYPGQSGHLHQSLYHVKTNKNAFYDQKAPHNMSKTMNQFIAGQIKYLKPLLAICAPTINSYTRLVKGFWAPTASTWGIENRTTAFRVIPGNDKSQRVEFRVGSADSNPYLTAAAMLGAGILGLKENLSLPAPVKGNAYAVQEKLGDQFQLSTSLHEAVQALKACSQAESILGSAFIKHFIQTREWEVREYNRHVNDWQLKRYFEII